MAWRAWLQSHTGRVVLQGAALAASVTSFSVYHLPQTLLLDQYKEFVQCYSKGLAAPVPPKVKEMYKRVTEDMHLEPEDTELIELFTVFGFDLFHAGSTAVRTGAVIGIPANFSYDSVKDVDRRIKVVNKSVDWESEVGQKLKESLLLSENARLFGIARELSAAQGVGFWFYDLYPMAAIMFTYGLSRTLNDKLHMRGHPFRFIMYSLVGCLGLALYFTFTDLTTAFLESCYDEDAISVGQNYAEGGVEFYRKLKERNKALRTLMGDVGPDVYTLDGNEIQFFRRKGTPLSDRLKKIEDYVANLNVSKNAT